MSTPVIVSLCDYTGNWSKPYKDADYEVILVDIKHGLDVLTWRCPPEIAGRVRGVLCAPPCTFFAVSGARWFKDPVRRPPEGLAHAVSVVNACLRIVDECQPRWWALENPVGTLPRHVERLGKPVLYFDPYQYAGWSPVSWAERYAKKTCLWGRFTHPFPRSEMTVNCDPIHLAPPGPDRQALRSVTPLGFAVAFYRVNP